jgi:phosphohistidine swiveling domain-containing protein
MDVNSIIQKYSLNKRTWTHKGFHGVLHFFFAVGEQALKPMHDYFGDSHSITVFYFSEDLGHWYWCSEDMVRLRKSFIKKANDNPKILDQLKKEWYQRLALLEEIMERIDRADFSKLSNNTLLSLYQEWYAAYIAEYGIAIGYQDSFSMHAQDFLFPHFSRIINGKGFADKLDEYYLTLMSPVDESFITQEYRDRLLLLKSVEEKKQILDQIKPELEKHAQKWHWVLNNYAKDICLDATYFKNQLQDILNKDPSLEIQRLDEELVLLKKKKRALIEKLDLNEESIILIKITELFAYMQDERKKYVLIATHYQNKFMQEFGNRLTLDRKCMEYTYIHELKKLLEQKKIDKSIFQERKDAVLVIHTLEGYEIYSGALAKTLHQKIFVQKQEDVSQIKGMIACQGKVTGTVKVVQKIHDIINVSEGDVLVASMTRPEMVLAMKKAVAIVTDEGGITSHAAVVSRELNIPCIIGTKIATKVLHDGDLVEVDATKGIVRKLK